MITIHLHGGSPSSIAAFARALLQAQWLQGVMRLNRRFGFKIRPGLN